MIFITHIRGLQIDGSLDGLGDMISLDEVIGDIVVDILMMFILWLT